MKAMISNRMKYLQRHYGQLVFVIRNVHKEIEVKAEPLSRLREISGETGGGQLNAEPERFVALRRG